MSLDEPGQTENQTKRPVELPLQGEAEFRRLLEKLPVGAYTCDPQGLITYFNQHAATAWGREPKLRDQADRYCGSFKLFASDGTFIRHDQCWMALALQSNTEFNGNEIIVEQPDGHRLTALTYVNPIRDDSGKLVGAVNVFFDITDRKRNEQIMEQADRAKDEFLATLAHELRNPLAPLRNAAQILRMQQPASSQSQWALDVIERQTQQMTRLIDDLLDVSRITRNKLELRTCRIDLADIIHVAVETSRPLIEAAGHQLSVALPESPLYLNADLTRLSQAVANLLNNAAKYTERGGHIHLAVERQGSDVVITVRDNGVGIPREMLPHVFEMFTQISRTLKRSQGGLGIGLSLVKRLVELHGGTVQVKSDGPGLGSEFIVRLPVIVESSRKPEALDRGDGDGNTGTSMRILIADDNRDSADSLAMLLRLTGNEVRTVYNGADAVSAATEYSPDVALLDIGMPELSGYQVAQQIRARVGGTGMVLVALTGWGQDGDRVRSKEAGFDHHMVKPVNPMAFLQFLVKVQQNLPSAISSHH